MTAFINDDRHNWGVKPICRVLPVPSTYYAAKARPHSARLLRDEELKEEILRVWKANFRVYGADKVWTQLNREGIAVARCTSSSHVRVRDQRRREGVGCEIRITPLSWLVFSIPPELAPSDPLRSNCSNAAARGLPLTLVSESTSRSRRFDAGEPFGSSAARALRIFRKPLPCCGRLPQLSRNYQVRRAVR
jgi:hypothetical protein